MARVSVIVPVYNTGKYVEKCLNSLTNQTIKDELEIIIIMMVQQIIQKK